MPCLFSFYIPPWGDVRGKRRERREREGKTVNNQQVWGAGWVPEIENFTRKYFHKTVKRRAGFQIAPDVNLKRLL